MAEDWDEVLRRADIAAVIEARIAIEAEAAALAAQRRTPADLRIMRKALAVRAGSDDSVDHLVDADTAFHRTVIAAAHNEVLLQLFDAFVPRVHRAMTQMLRMRPMADPPRTITPTRCCSRRFAIGRPRRRPRPAGCT